MASQPNYSRWWENYLVRYLMPSIAGMIIVNWLITMSGDELRQILFFTSEKHFKLDAPNLILIFLYGNLFCYVASYPILIFHGTRVLDFENNSWKCKLYDGYINTFIVFILAIFATQISQKCYLGIMASFFLVLSFSIAQFYRISKVFSPKPYDQKYIKHDSSLVYSFTQILAMRRGKIEDINTIVKENKSGIDNQSCNTDTKRTNIWRKEVVDTYRHMREHGNSAFIFVLEVTLAALCYSIVSSNLESEQMLACLGILLSIWAAPAVGIHLLGQHLERRFSLYDFKNKTGPK